jgi:hypoxanthine phosphoribosyltransferase
MGHGFRCELVGWDEVQRLARDLAQRLRADGFAPDIIVSIGRGGWIPGRLLSDYLGILNLTELKVEHYKGTEKQAVARIAYPLRADLAGQLVLVVDDVTDTGDSFAVALKHIHSRGEPAQLRTAVLHHKSLSSYVPDYFGKAVSDWRWIIYPWAMMEDLSALIAKMDPAPAGAEEVAGRLLRDHGITVPLDRAEEVLDLCTAILHRGNA